MRCVAAELVQIVLYLVAFQAPEPKETDLLLKDIAGKVLSQSACTSARVNDILQELQRVHCFLRNNEAEEKETGEIYVQTKEMLNPVKPRSTVAGTEADDADCSGVRKKAKTVHTDQMSNNLATSSTSYFHHALSKIQSAL